MDIAFEAPRQPRRSGRRRRGGSRDQALAGCSRRDRRRRHGAWRRTVAGRHGAQRGVSATSAVGLEIGRDRDLLAARQAPPVSTIVRSRDRRRGALLRRRAAGRRRRGIRPSRPAQLRRRMGWPTSMRPDASRCRRSRPDSGWRAPPPSAPRAPAARRRDRCSPCRSARQASSRRWPGHRAASPNVSTPPTQPSSWKGAARRGPHEDVRAEPPHVGRRAARGARSRRRCRRRSPRSSRRRRCRASGASSAPAAPKRRAISAASASPKIGRSSPSGVRTCVGGHPRPRRRVAAV